MASKRQRAAVRLPGLPVLLIFFLWRPLWAGEDPPRLSQRNGASARSVLLLTNGRLVEGNIYRDANGYVVELSNGRMMIPPGQVQMEAKSSHEVYVKLRDTIPPSGLNQHLLLATWCVTHELYDEARREIETVLKVDPDHRTARRMLRRLEALIAPPKRTTPEKKPSLYERLTAPEVTSLAGFSPEVARYFTARIQPLLMNSCAVTGCHGPRAGNGLQLSIVHLRAGNRRGLTERNLSTVLRYIDLRRPEQSPLLLQPLGNHGRRGRPVFRGRAGARQQEELRKWVYRVAAENRARVADPSAPSGRPSAASPSSSPATSVAPATTVTPASPAAEVPPKTSSGVAPSSGSLRPNPLALPQNPVGLPPEPVHVPIRQGFGIPEIPLSYQPTPAMRAARARLRRPASVQENRRDNASRSSFQQISGYRNPRDAELPHNSASRKPPVADPFDPAEFNRSPAHGVSPRLFRESPTFRQRAVPLSPPSSGELVR